MNNQLDPQLVNLAKAIRQTESGGNPTALGKSGEYGSYQFTEPTWNEQAKKFGINVPLKQASPQQQNEVAYKQLAEWKQQHPDWNIGHFASAWNAGQGEANAFQGTFSNGKPSVGVNKFGVRFSVPDYAKSVATAYQSIKAGSMPGIDPNNPSAAIDTSTPAQQPASPYTGALGTNPGDDWFGKLIDNSVTRAIQSIFPGSKVGQAIGTLGGYAASGFDKNYDTSAPSPLQVAGDVAQGALMVGTGMPEGQGISAFGKVLPTLEMSTAKGLAGVGMRTAQNAALGSAYGITGAVAGGSTDPTEIFKQGLLGGSLGGITGLGAEALSGIFNSLPKRYIQKTMPNLTKDANVEYALKNTKFGTIDGMVKNSEDALNSYEDLVQAMIKHPDYKPMGDVIDVTKKIAGKDIIGEVASEFPNSEYTGSSIFKEVKRLAKPEAALVTKLENGTIDVEEGNILRRALDKKTYKVSQFDTPEVRAGKELIEAVGNALRKKVQTIAPETAPVFEEYSKELNLLKGLKKIQKKGASKSLSMFDLVASGLGHSVGGIPGAIAAPIVEKVLTSPASKINAAKILNKAAPLAKPAAQALRAAGTVLPGRVAANSQSKI